MMPTYMIGNKNEKPNMCPFEKLAISNLALLIPCIKFAIFCAQIPSFEEKPGFWSIQLKKYFFSKAHIQYLYLAFSFLFPSVLNHFSII